MDINEINARLVRIETKLSVLMNALGFDTFGNPLGVGKPQAATYEEKQPISNAPRDPFVIHRASSAGGYKYDQRN